MAVHPATARVLGIPELVSEVVCHLEQPDLVSTARVNKIWQANTALHLYKRPDLGSQANSPSFLARLSLLILTLETKPSFRALVKEMRLMWSEARPLLDKLLRLIDLVEDFEPLMLYGACAWFAGTRQR